MPSEEDLSAKVINLCQRRGLVVASSEIYGGMAGFFDFIGYGAQVKRRVESAWWKRFVESRSDVVGLEGSIITHPHVWRASGHTEAFNDPMVSCEKCRERFRADHLLEDEAGVVTDGISVDALKQLLAKHALRCPKCGGSLSVLNLFNLMFKTQVGVDMESYLRPETAQVIFADFKAAQAAGRKQLPFGIAQLGRAFRNEISPRNFVFRSREFTQMELEYFVHPEKLDDCPYLADRHLDAKVLVLVSQDGQPPEEDGSETTIRKALEAGVIGTKWHAYWLAECLAFLKDLGLAKNLRIRRHSRLELSHYSSETWDVEYKYPWGWKELLGIANRTDFDLKQHAAHSGKDMAVFDEGTKQKVLPHVFEPSMGVERLVFTLLMDAYSEPETASGSTVVLHLKPRVAPFVAGVLPLMKKDGLAEKAREIWDELKSTLPVEYDESGSVGKRYARFDEVGVPYCVTIDYDTLNDGTVTIRDRDSTKQRRVPTASLAAVLERLSKGSMAFENAGTPVGE